MEKNESETLKEQRKARNSFLELKKMQQEGAPEKEEVKESTKTKLKTKLHYAKGGLILVLLVAVVFAIGVSQCVAKEKYDLKVAVYSYCLMSDSEAGRIEEYFEKYVCDDYNGDGKVNVAVTNCTYQAGASTAQYQNVMMTKLQSIIASDAETVIFITNKECYDYITNLDGEADILYPYTDLGEDFYEYADKDEYHSLEKGLVIAKRDIRNTFMEENETAIKYSEYADMVLDKLK